MSRLFPQRGVRPAHSLVELLVALTVMGVITTIGVKAVNHVLHDHRQATAFHDVERSSVRLTRQMRRDAHQSTDCRVEESPQRIVLTMRSDERQPTTVEYRWEADSITRLQLVGEKPLSQETYAFTPGVRWTIEKKQNPTHLEVIAITDFEVVSLERMSSKFVTPVALHLLARLGTQAATSDSDGRNQ